MQLFRTARDLPESLLHGAVTIGNFDGVHRGHAALLERLKAQAERVGGPAIVFTFDPHPVRLLRPSETPPPLTWTDRKAELLFDLGVSAVISYPTDLALLSLTAGEFFESILRQTLAARAVVEGPNFYFGKGREGNVHTLAKLCESAGMTFEVVEPTIEAGAIVSSSRVRQLIVDGNVGEASQLLTRPYRIRGMVTHGAQRGSKIGFPTANVDAIDTLLPKLGVYAARAITSQGTFAAALNLGPNPTFGEHATKVEAHLLGFSGSLYGQPIELDFLAHLRDIRPFASIDALKQQLALDVAATQAIVARHSS
ncbi:riboflavin biosynthesis protein RibF [Pirellula staleyi DSM 6068]|uniref:Riboflavin biosynthesis protein n=1 Tax=Pirellula staleyi (strain ATCC 27377 / DSM 6068 / ICPB 4128) TaxID=530564 RepID=D2R116_PIRSD|nr:bifunctional riboflavin kinase/FAD synthetase [Pirellula staleyi]ADB18501.1 riboflavin biosynthesis protein RibF [Pirellula staleyi DSM 6068]